MEQRVIPFNNKLSEVVREFLRLKQTYISYLHIEKIVVYQDEVKSM